MFQEYLQNRMDDETTVLATRKAWRTYRAPVGVDQNQRITMICDLQDDHRGSPDDSLLCRTSKSVTLWDAFVIVGNEGKDMRNKKGWRTKRRQEEADEKIVEFVEGRRTVTRRSEVAAKAARRRKDTRGMKLRLGLESDAAAKKIHVIVLCTNIAV